MENTMEALIGELSDKDLEDMKAKFTDKPSTVLMIDGILESRKAEANKAKILDQFGKALEKTFAKLPHPETVHNVFARWGETDMVDESAEAEDTEIIDTPAILNGDGQIITPATFHNERRRPTIKVMAWVVTVNYAQKVVAGTTGNATPKASKRSIKVLKRDGLQLVDKGIYPSASKACEAFGLPLGGDSGTRVLAREGYIVEPHEGDITTG